MSWRDYSPVDDRYDPSRDGQLDLYGSGYEDSLDRYDPNDDNMKASPEPREVELVERYDPSREARRERYDRPEGRRRRHSFGSRFLLQMMEEIRESVWETVGAVRPARQARPRPSLETRLSQPRSQVPYREQTADLIEFRRLNPPTFNGEGDPRIAEEWLECINQYLDTLGIENGGQRVSLAVFQLTYEARHWWKVEGRSIGDSWEEFEKVFQNQYIPYSAVNRLRCQFQELTQGDKTVDKYAQEFNSLSRYAPDLVANKDQRCRRFEEGLRAPIRDRVLAHLYSDFNTLVESARAAERSWELTLKEREGRKFQGASSSKGDSHAKKRKSSSSESGSEVAKRAMSVGSSSREALRSTSDRPLVCRLCDQPGHILTHCPRFAQARASVSRPRFQQQRTGGSKPFDRGSVVCFECRQPGHYRRDCPILAGASQATSTGPAPTQQSQRFHQTQDDQYARSQAKIPRGGGRGGNAGKGKVAAMAVEDEPGTSRAYHDA